MIRPLPFYIALRYIRAKRRNRYISFISFASTIGITLGVMVLITVLSVMNGFDKQIRSHFFAIAPQVTISSEEDLTDSWSQLLKTVKQQPQVIASAPFISAEGMLIKGNNLRGVTILGIIPDQEIKVSALSHELVDGHLNTLTPDSFNIIIGQSLAQQLGAEMGHTVNVLTAQASTTPLGLFPRYRPFTISGIYTNSSSGFEQSKAFIAIDDANKLFAAGAHSTGLHLKLVDLYQAPKVTSALIKLLPSYKVTDWTVESGVFFQALAMEKIMMFIILLLIIAIAVFNLISMLIMVVHEKQADIAILRTLGATPSMIRNTFIFQGSVLGLVGTLAGLVTGLILTLNITPVVNALQRWFHVQFIPTTAYWSNYLPIKIMPKDIIEVCCVSLVLSVLATLYPAWVAFRIQPAEALRYE